MGDVGRVRFRSTVNDVFVSNETKRSSLSPWTINIVCVTWREQTITVRLLIIWFRLEQSASLFVHSNLCHGPWRWPIKNHHSHTDAVVFHYETYGYVRSAHLALSSIRFTAQFEFAVSNVFIGQKKIKSEKSEGKPRDLRRDRWQC